MSPLLDAPALLAESRPWSVPAGAQIFAVGEPVEMVHIVRDGVAYLSTSTLDGDTGIVDVRARGELLDDTALLADGPRLHLEQAVALTACDLLRVPVHSFERLCDESALIGAAVLAGLTAQTRRKSDCLVDALGRSARARAARRLRDVAEALTRAGQEGIELSLTQADLARYVGGTRSTLNPLLGEMQDAGALRVSRGRLAITDRAALDRFV